MGPMVAGKLEVARFQRVLEAGVVCTEYVDDAQPWQRRSFGGRRAGGGERAGEQQRGR